MELVCQIESHQQLNKLKPLVNYFLLKYPFTLFDEVVKASKTPILDFAEMVYPSKLHNYRTCFLKYATSNCLFYITDLGLAKILKEMGLIERTIYDPKTMICNLLDAKEYANYGFLALGLSNEIKIVDINKISDNVKAFLEVFGYRLMFHSARKLVSLYGDKLNIELENGQYYIQEQTRPDLFPLKQNDNGTYIYRSYLLSLLKELPNLNIKFAYLSLDFISFDLYYNVVKLFKEAIDGKEIKMLLREFDRLKLNVSDGFSHQDSIYQKEDF